MIEACINIERYVFPFNLTKDPSILRLAPSSEIFYFPFIFYLLTFIFYLLSFFYFLSFIFYLLSLIFCFWFLGFVLKGKPHFHFTEDLFKFKNKSHLILE